MYEIQSDAILTFENVFDGFILNDDESFYISRLIGLFSL